MPRIFLLIAFALLMCCALAGCSNTSTHGSLSAASDHAVALGSSPRQQYAADDDDDDNDDEQEIPLSDVPQNVMAAALAAVPGIVFEEAERETENGVVVYCLEGEASGREYEVEVSADGTLREVEAAGDDDDHDDRGDD